MGWRGPRWQDHWTCQSKSWAHNNRTGEGPRVSTMVWITQTVASRVTTVVNNRQKKQREHNTPQTGHLPCWCHIADTRETVWTTLRGTTNTDQSRGRHRLVEEICENIWDQRQWWQLSFFFNLLYYWQDSFNVIKHCSLNKQRCFHKETMCLRLTTINVPSISFSLIQSCFCCN